VAVVEGTKRESCGLKIFLYDLAALRLRVNHPSRSEFPITDRLDSNVAAGDRIGLSTP
jgi:hypothetical protein